MMLEMYFPHATCDTINQEIDRILQSGLLKFNGNKLKLPSGLL
jgi:hypothetical protein